MAIVKKILTYCFLINCCVSFSQKIGFSIRNDSINNKFSLRTITNEVLETITIKKNDFNVDIRFEEGYYVLKKDENEVLLYLKPNDEFTISFDSDNFYESLVFTGDGSGRNTYLLNIHKESIDKIGKRGDFYAKKMYEGNENDYLSKLDELYKHFFSTLFSGNLDKMFVSSQMKDLQYAYFLDLLKFDEAKKHYKFNDSIVASSSFLEELTPVPFDNSFFYNRYYSYKKLSTLKWKKEIESSSNNKERQKIIASIRTEPLRESILESLHKAMSKEEPKKMESYFKLIKANSRNNTLIASAKEKYAEIRQFEAEKNLAEFNYLNHENEKVKLSDFKGKYLFIYVWASWCENCVKELEEIKRLRKKYKGEAITFIGVSVDKKEDFDTWAGIVKEHDMNGSQLFLNDSKSKFIKMYGISTIPNSFLLSLKGEKMEIKIEDLSSKKIKKTLNKVLK